MENSKNIIHIQLRLQFQNDPNWVMGQLFIKNGNLF